MSKTGNKMQGLKFISYCLTIMEDSPKMKNRIVYQKLYLLLEETI